MQDSVISNQNQNANLVFYRMGTYGVLDRVKIKRECYGCPPFAIAALDLIGENVGVTRTTQS